MYAKEEVLKEFDDIGFGNQARIVGAKRVELLDFLSQALDEAYIKGGSDNLALIRSQLTFLGNCEECEANNNYLKDLQSLERPSEREEE